MLYNNYISIMKSNAVK